MQFGSQNWENILVVIGIDVTPPKVYLDHFGVGKSQPIAKMFVSLSLPWMTGSISAIHNSFKTY